MSIGLVGRKLGMTRVFNENGTSVPVTVIQVEANRVTQIKNLEKDGYTAIQVTTGDRKASRMNFSSLLLLFSSMPATSYFFTQKFSLHSFPLSQYIHDCEAGQSPGRRSKCAGNINAHSCPTRSPTCDSYRHRYRVCPDEPQ